MGTQKYEDYWSITLEYSNIHGERFRYTLSIIVNFIKKNKGHFSQKLFNNLQREVYDAFPKVDMASVRKSINQFVKLGFINFQLKSYHKNAIDFLEARTCRKRQSIFSKIVYTNSSFNRSVTVNSNQQEINFLIKTLENVGKLDKRDIAGLMRVIPSNFSKGYLTPEELKIKRDETRKIRFAFRKYNQITYLINILKKLDDLIFVKGYLYFQDDAQIIFGDYLKKKYRIRDSYLYRLYKNQLKEESIEKLGDVKCMLEKLGYPVLVASHIKPFIKSSQEEAYDPDNGLLLSKTMDGLFDLGYISFENDGKIMLSKKLSKELKEHLKNYYLNNIFLTKKRLKYLKYHKKKIFRK